MKAQREVHPLRTRLADLRETAGLTLAQVGERAGMPLQQIGAYEIGTTVPGLKNLARWAAVFGLNVELR